MRLKPRRRSYNGTQSAFADTNGNARVSDATLPFPAEASSEWSSISPGAGR